MVPQINSDSLPVDKKVHVHDLHATILHLMGLDHENSRSATAVVTFA